MLDKLWSFLLCVYGLVHQALVPCPAPDLLPANSLNTQQYLGKWYFIAAVGFRDADIHMFRGMDSSVFSVEETSVKDTLQMTADMRVGDLCLKQTWTYYVRPERDDLEVEGRPTRRTLIWSGKWVGCPQCIILQEIEPPRSETEAVDSLSRHLLYARQSDVDPTVVAAFQENSACNNLTAFVKLPQTKELCH
ncbi:apolipoprotein M [Myripristis murdjan]|uniref:apolipoprotein M n=1 Tax=Myripristis murdjan TaxID=586833 RepID=UPI001176105C|nr:apolipoprotein M [Myripristis murdjan]